MNNIENLKKIALTLPLKPGCYIFKDTEGEVLYVGKSKCLRKRIVSYFNPKDDKIAQMMRFAVDLSYQAVNTDAEALLLEYNLIKQHRPLYNKKMRQDRQHWYINVEGPALLISEKKGKTSAGPFVNKEHAAESLAFIGDYWPVATCELKRKEPCLRFHIKQCLGPCIGNLDAKYNKAMKDVTAFINGDLSVVEKLDKQIKKAARDMAFEKAARLRDQQENLYILSRQLERMPPDLRGKNYFVLVESRHDDGFLWVYMEDGCVRVWMSFPAEELVIFGYEEGLQMGRAVVEVEALRRFIEA